MALASSAFLTISGISIYSLASLLSFLRAHGGHGVSLWIDQMSELIFGPLPAPSESYRNDECLSFSGERDEAQWSGSEDHADQRFEPKREGLATPSSVHEPLSREDDGDL
ncbi:hypothetical protein C0993_000189, partial [Termitomyces sp. T159_Od127]